MDEKGITIGVAAVIWNAEGQVLLIRRRNPPCAGQWSLPGGRVERGERLEDGVRREVEEETGLEIVLLGLAGVAEITNATPLGGNGHYVLIDFTARLVSGTAQGASDAYDATWFAPDALPETLWSETRRIIAASRAQLSSLQSEVKD